MSRLAWALTVGLWGAAVMASVIISTPRSFSSDLLMATGMIGLAFVVATAGGWVVAMLYSKANAALSFAAGIFATTIAGMLGGLFIGIVEAGLNPLAGAMLGAIYIWPFICKSPVSIVVWLIGALLMHLMARRHSLK